MNNFTKYCIVGGICALIQIIGSWIMIDIFKIKAIIITPFIVIGIFLIKYWMYDSAKILSKKKIDINYKDLKYFIPEPRH